MKRLLLFLIMFSFSLFSTAQKADFKTAEKLILIRKDRQLKNLDVCLVNAETGVLSVLFSEGTWPYFNDEYTRLSVLNEGNDIIWWSERTGWGQLYLYDGKGNLKNQITNGYFVTGRVEVKDSLNKKKEVEISFKGVVEKNQDLAKNLKGHLMLVTGDIDNNVHPGNTLRVVDALIAANKRFDFMMLPGQRHAYGNEVPYFDRIMWYYFAEHLLGDYRTSVDLLEFE